MRTEIPDVLVVGELDHTDSHEVITVERCDQTITAARSRISDPKIPARNSMNIGHALGVIP